MGSAFHQLCPRYSETLTSTAPTAMGNLYFTFTSFTPTDLRLCSFRSNGIRGNVTFKVTKSINLRDYQLQKTLSN